MKGDIIKYRQYYKYQLVETYKINTDILDFSIDTKFIKLNPQGELTIVEGYAWDGASGPTIDTASTMRGSLVHDAFYQLMREKLISLTYRKHIDDIFRTIIEEDGMWKIRAILWQEALHTFAEPAADPKNDKKIYSAP